MDLGELRTFVEVSEAGSFTAAADRLGYTQSAVSRQVAGLESDLGSVLLRRRARGVSLTAEGEALLPHARAVLRRVEVARVAVDTVHRAEEGLLRIGAIPSVNAHLVPRAIAALRDSHPRITVTLLEAGSAALSQAVDADEVDLAVVASYPGGTTGPPPGAPVLGEDPLLVALHREHPLAGRPDLRLADLAGDTWAEHFPFSGDSLRAAARADGFDPSIAYEVREWTGKLGFAATGLGVTLVPAYAAIGARSDVVLRDLHHPMLRRTVFLLRRAGAPPIAATFATALQGVAQEAAARGPR